MIQHATPFVGAPISTRRAFHYGEPTHKLDPARVVIGLADQLRHEFGASWYALVTFADGRMIGLGPRTSSPAPGAETIAVMRACAAMLNRSLHHGGCWVVVWHVERLAFMWRDADGDAAFICQVHEPWFRVRMWAAHEFCERAEAAWSKWDEMIHGWFDRRPNETIKQALGQKSAGRSAR